MNIKNGMVKNVLAYAFVFILLWISATIVWYLLGLILDRPSQLDFYHNLKVGFILAVVGIVGPITGNHLTRFYNSMKKKYSSHK